MNCPHCGLQITDPRLPNCPRCGQPLYAPAPDQQPQSDTPTYPGYGGYGAQAPTPPASYGAPPTPSNAGEPYAGQQPSGAQPGYPTYGQPSYGQPAGPSTPMYGQPYQPNAPYYGQGAPGGYPMPSQPGYPTPQPPKRRRNLGLIIGIPVAIVLVLCIGGFAALAYIGSHASTSTGTSTSTNTSTTATSTPGEQVLFQDALTLGSHNDNWPNDSHCTFANDGYHIKSAYLCYAPTSDVSDGTITVNATQANGDTTQGYGLVFRRTSKGNYYAFAIDGSGEWAFYKFVNDSGTAVKDFTKSPAIKTGLNAMNTLKVTMSGSNFTFYVNGTQVGQATDSTFTSGKSGLLGGDNIETVYTAYKITK